MSDPLDRHPGVASFRDRVNFWRTVGREKRHDNNTGRNVQLFDGRQQQCWSTGTFSGTTVPVYVSSI